MKSRKQLIVGALSRFIPGILIISGILFLSAGTVSFWNAWLFMGVLFIPMFFVMIYLIVRDPDLLGKRINTKEPESRQRAILFSTIIIFPLSFILSGLDYRFEWSSVPFWLELLSALIVFIGYILFFVVMKQNTYASRVVEIQEKQKVITSGLYSVVRHPMYFAAVMMFLFMPLLLGSFIALIPMLIFPVQINERIKNEEVVLEKGLEGYVEYKMKVKYKVIPYLW
jgi:protein-S-isoprenylcysteine O-methyltransferase Ste14